MFRKVDKEEATVQQYFDYGELWLAEGANYWKRGDDGELKEAETSIKDYNSFGS